MTLYSCARILVSILLNITPSFRAYPGWSYRQALGVEVLKTWFTLASSIEYQFPLSLEAGFEKERFVRIPPQAPELYRDIPDVPNCDIMPKTIGGVWYPRLFKANQDEDRRVILHFHGGAYVLGSPRQSECGFAANTLYKATSALLFFPQYRLASTEGGAFPAALQDAITSYGYLLALGLSPCRITVSGDSAGGHLAVSLLRYISNSMALLPSPCATLLWSPWLDLASEHKAIDLSTKAQVDFVTTTLVRWAIRVFAPPTMDLSHPYLSPLRHPFGTQTAIWIQIGKFEVLYGDIVAFYRSMKSVSLSSVELHEIPFAPHDILLGGNILGFETEASIAAEHANGFLDRVKY